MPLLFSYGTLQHDDVQQAAFGRLLRGNEDELGGYEPSLVKIGPTEPEAAKGKTHHANVTFNGRPESRVAGMAFEVTDAELAAADEYERSAAYVRKLVDLVSGRKAWVYVHAPPG